MRTISRWICCWIGVALLAWNCAPALALVVVPPESNVNLSPPNAQIPWDHVGNYGIYLGHRWVLTAHHLHAQQVSIANVQYFAQPGSTVRLRNADNTFTDMEMFYLTADPGLPPISIATSTPAVGMEVTFIGDGKTVGDEKYWNVTQNATPPPNYIWNPVTESDPYNRSGYGTTTPLKFWGTNVVEDDQGFEDIFPDEPDPDHTVVIEDPNPNPLLSSFTVSFFTEFDAAGITDGLATAHEAHAQGDDSAGGVFEKVGDTWVLSGLILAVAGFENQPDPTSNAVFGNLTFAADLQLYREQILSVMGVPEPGGFLMVGFVGAMLGLVRLGVRRRR